MHHVLLFILNYLLTRLFNYFIQQNILLYYHVEIILVIRDPQYNWIWGPYHSSYYNKQICRSDLKLLQQLCLYWKFPSCKSQARDLSHAKYRAMEPEHQPKQRHEALVRTAHQTWHCSCLMDLPVPSVLVSSGISYPQRDTSSTKIPQRKHITQIT